MSDKFKMTVIRHMNEAPCVSVHSKPAANLTQSPYVAITDG